MAAADPLVAHLVGLRACRRCPGMVGPVVTPPPVRSPIYLVGQAPGPREGAIGRPFGWTAGRTLFAWFGSIGVDEATFRAGAYIAAVCRCFPGKAAGGGDRVPAREEIAACSGWMRSELAMLRPALVIPVGRLAIERCLGVAPLADTVGRVHRGTLEGHPCEILPLPHPSGLSAWWKREPGRSLLAQALGCLARHPTWRGCFPSSTSAPCNVSATGRG